MAKGDRVRSRPRMGVESEGGKHLVLPSLDHPSMVRLATLLAPHDDHANIDGGVGRTIIAKDLSMCGERGHVCELAVLADENPAERMANVCAGVDHSAQRPGELGPARSIARGQPRIEPETRAGMRERGAVDLHLTALAARVAGCSHAITQPNRRGKIFALGKAPLPHDVMGTVMVEVVPALVIRIHEHHAGVGEDAGRLTPTPQQALAQPADLTDPLNDQTRTETAGSGSYTPPSSPNDSAASIAAQRPTPQPLRDRLARRRELDA